MPPSYSLTSNCSERITTAVSFKMDGGVGGETYSKEKKRVKSKTTTSTTEPAYLVLNLKCFL